MRKLLPSVLAFGLFAGLSLPVSAEKILPLATGEFAPYTGALLPGYGVSSQVVKKAFAKAGHDTVLVFLPWRRAANMAEKGRYAGSFPWSKNAEREQSYLFSEAIAESRMRFFAKLNDELDLMENWQSRRLCIPDGWNTVKAQPYIDRHQLQLVRPSDLESCFRMLGAGRLDLVLVNQDAGRSALLQLGDLGEPIVPVGEKAIVDSYYLMIARDYPDADQLISDFNAGLQQLKQDSTYQRLQSQTVHR